MSFDECCAAGHHMSGIRTPECCRLIEPLGFQTRAVLSAALQSLFAKRVSRTQTSLASMRSQKTLGLLSLTSIVTAYHPIGGSSTSDSGMIG